MSEDPLNKQKLVPYLADHIEGFSSLKHVKKFSIAKDIDPEYYRNSLLAKSLGVKFLAYKCRLNYEGINIIREIEIIEN